MLAVESIFEFSPTQRRSVGWRLDGGFGSDDNLNWLLGRDYQVMAKGASHRRAEKLAQQVTRWDQFDETAWLAWHPTPVEFVRPVHTLVKRRLVEGQFRHSYYYGTPHLSSKGDFMRLYNQRGADETEIRADKSGLFLSERRKHHQLAQEGLVLFTDLAHNLIAHFQHQVLADTPFAGYGLKRIVRDLFAIPGRLYFEADELKRIELLSTHPYADQMLKCLEKYCNRG